MFQKCFRTNSHVMSTDVALWVVAAKWFCLTVWMPFGSDNWHLPQLKVACHREVPQPNLTQLLTIYGNTHTSPHIQQPFLLTTLLSPVSAPCIIQAPPFITAPFLLLSAQWACDVQWSQISRLQHMVFRDGHPSECCSLNSWPPVTWILFWYQ